MEIIYQGQDIVVFIEHGDPALDTVVFSFSGYGMHKTPNPRYADSFLQKLGVTSVFFTTKDDHWWQTAEMPEAIHAANVATVNVSRRITYGQSMGGYGAAAFAGDLKARYLITAPQLTVLPDRAPLHQVWQDAYAGRVLAYPDASLRMRGISGVIIFDSLHPIDRFHANLLADLEGGHKRLIVPLASHFVPRTLTEAGVFSALVSDLIKTDIPDYAAHRRIIRKHRLKSPRYVEILEMKLRSRTEPGLWLYAEGAILNFLKETKAQPVDRPYLFTFLISYQSKWGSRFSKIALERRLMASARANEQNVVTLKARHTQALLDLKTKFINSNSWRLTEPFRAFSRMIRRSS